MKAISFGSLNIDYTFLLDHIAAPGETITSRERLVSGGGKGLNQAIALSRAGMDTYMAGLIGEDGRFLYDVCASNKIDTSLLTVIDQPTANALIQVSDGGENAIFLFPGANRCQSEEIIREKLSGFEKGDLVLIQNEINLSEVVIEEAKRKGMLVAANPSPFDKDIAKWDLGKIDYLILNEIEGMQFTGKEDENEIIAILSARYPKMTIVLTLGEKGAICFKDGKIYREPARKVKAVDTTSAGDTFTGYFLREAIYTGDIQSALKVASYASSITVSRKGSATSIPSREELDL